VRTSFLPDEGQGSVFLQVVWAPGAAS
jgi:hypothetical protein